MADANIFRQAWGKYPTGVAVVTSIESEGHVHGMANSVRSRMYFNFKTKPPRIEDHMQLFGITGSYLKTYIKGVITYSEKAMYQPNSLGCLKIIVRPYDLSMRMERYVV